MLVIIAIIYFTISTFFNANEIKQKNRTASYQASIQISTKINHKIASITTLIMRFYKTPWINKYMSGSFSNEFTAYNCMEYSRDLELIAESTNVVEKVALIFPETDTLVRSYSWSNINDGILFFINNYDIDLSSIIHGLSKNQNRNSSSTFYYEFDDYIILTSDLEITNSPKGTALFLISKESLFKDVDSYLSVSSDGRLQKFVLSNKSSEGTLNDIFTVSNDITNESIFETITVDSDIAGWTYRYYFKDIIPTELSNRTLLTLLILPVFMTLSCIAIYWISIFSFKPINHIFTKILTNRHETSTSLNAVENACDCIIEENSQMKETTAKYCKAIKSNFLIRLIRGYFVTKHERDDFANSLNEYEIPFDENSSFIVCIITISDDHIKEYSVDQLTSFIEFTSKSSPISTYNGVLVEISISEIAVILQYPLDIQNAHTSEIEDFLLSSAGSILGFWPEVSVGPICKGIIGISKSYHKAVYKRGDDIALTGGNNLEEKFQVYYPLDWELQLADNIEQGNIGLEQSILREIITENTKSNLSQGDEIRLASMLYNTIVKVINDNDVDISLFQDKLDQLLSSTTVRNRWDSIHSIINDVHQVLVAKKSEKIQFDPEQKLIDYVKLHYNDSNLSLKELAQQFNTSVSAVSRSFKKSTGVNFLEYITKLRMEKAKKLILIEECSISDMFKMVGYENEYSFRRAFERYQGVRLQHYRKELTPSNEEPRLT